MEDRTKAIAGRIIRLSAKLMKDDVGRVLARQILRSGTAVGANYRAAGRARSRADFTSKLGIVEEEADETIYWLELIIAEKLLPVARIRDLLVEAEEILAIVSASRISAKRRKP